MRVSRNIFFCFTHFKSIFISYGLHPDEVNDLNLLSSNEIDSFCNLYENTHIKVADVSTPTGQIIELIEYINPKPQNAKSSERAELTASHIAFNVTNIQEVYEFLIKSGGVSLNPPIEITEGKSVCYLQDPFGNWLELIEMS